MSTKILSESPIVSGDFFTVNEVNLELKDGTNRTYKNVYRMPSASVFPLNDAGEILLIKQYRYMYRKYLIEPIGGMINNEEPPLEAAKRELEEEAGITAEHIRPLVVVNPAGSIIAWTSYLFVATKLTENMQHLEADEDITVLKIPLDEAVQMAMSGEILSNSALTGILMIRELKRRGEL